MDLHRTHQLDAMTKVFTQRHCWSVIFDVRGNAPADATVASFATEELADEARELWAAIKDDGKTVNIIVGGVRHWDLPNYSVEGYDFDTYYRVAEDWQPTSNILTSLAQLAEICQCSEITDQPDGITLTAGDDSDSGDDLND